MRGGIQLGGEDGGQVDAEEALLASDWSEVRLPPPDGHSAELPSKGPGWRLVISPSWRASRDEKGWLLEPPASSGGG